MWAEITNYHWGWIGFGFVHMALIGGFFILAIFPMMRFLSPDDKLTVKQPIMSPTVNEHHKTGGG
jgi:hypothetical protein